MMPSDPLVGGVALRRPAIQSPNFVAGVSGWSINADGSAQFNQLTLIVQVTGAAILIYSGSAGAGNLIGSWSGATSATTDQFGNTVPPGLFANSGQLLGILLTNPQIVGATIISSLLNGPTITAASIQGGSMVETAITFDQGGGLLLVYTSTTTTVTLTSGTTWTAPAGSYTSGKVECIGGGAGAGGGNSANGGETGGAGEYAAEPNYPLIPGSVYQIQIGGGGTGGTTGFPGNSGDDTVFDLFNLSGSGVLANGGDAGINFLGGQGGQGSPATIAHPGGNGANAGTSTGGSSGANSGNATGAGNNGIQATTAAGAPSPAVQTGSGTGGAGGNNAANGTAGGAPGASGGGAGASTSATSGSSQFRLSASETFYGSDASSSAPPNGQRGSGTMYQGGETASGGGFNGTMKSMGIVGGNPAGTLAGKTIDSVTIALEMLHSWYNSGAQVYLGYTNNSSIPSSYNGASTAVKNWSQSTGSRKTTDLTNAGLGSALQSGAAKAIILGPGSGGFNLNNYCYFYGAGGDNNQNPLITVNWHTGSAPTQAGNGSAGQITITLQTGQKLVASISPVAGTDPLGNPYPSGHGGINIPMTTNTTATHQFTTTGNTAIPGLSAQLAANATYEVELEVFGIPSGTIGGQHTINMAFTGSGTMTTNSVSWQATSTSTATDQRTNFGVSGSVFPLACATSPPHQGFACWSRLAGTIVTTQAGTLTPGISLSIAGDDVTLQAGTRLVVTRTA